MNQDGDAYIRMPLLYQFIDAVNAAPLSRNEVAEVLSVSESTLTRLINGAIDQLGMEISYSRKRKRYTIKNHGVLSPLKMRALGKIE